MWKPTAAVDAEYLKEIEKARRELRALISGENCAPHMLRLAWYAAGTYDANMRPGKLDGSVKHEVEAYEGLKTAVDFCGAQHSREVFHRMGLTDKDIVALCGAHTLGEAHDEPSGSQGQRTRKTLKFDNSYFVELESSGKAPRQPVSIGKPRLPLPTDNALLEDPGFRNYVKIYAKDEDAFFKDYAASHKKLSELAFKRKHLEIIVSCKGL